MRFIPRQSLGWGFASTGNKNRRDKCDVLLNARGATRPFSFMGFGVSVPFGRWEGNEKHWASESHGFVVWRFYGYYIWEGKVSAMEKFTCILRVHIRMICKREYDWLFGHYIYRVPPVSPRSVPER